MLKTFALCLLFIVSVAHADLKLYTEDAPPLNYLKDGKPDGVAVALILEIQKNISDKTPIEFVPWARGYNSVQTEANVGLFSTTRTEEREKLFKWVGPLAGKNWVFVKKKGSSVVIKSMDDAKKLKSVGTYTQDAKEQYLKKEGFTNLDSTNSDDLNAKKLAGGRLDAWITGEDDMKSYAQKAGVSLDDLEVAFVVQKKELYLVFSQQTDDAIVKKWQDGFDAILKSG